MTAPLHTASSAGATPAGAGRVCPACDHANPQDARFCNACGSPVHLRECDDCGAINDDAASGCYKCGASLASRALDHDPGGPHDEFLPRPDRMEQVPEPSAPQASFETAPGPHDGLPMLEECPQCEAVNDPGATLCHACEAPLTDLLDRSVHGDPADISDDHADALITPHPAFGAEQSLVARPLPGGIAQHDTPVIESAMAPAIDATRVRQDATIDSSSSPAHYLGVLTAPADEAELEEADLHLDPRRARRIGWVVAALVLAPSLAVTLLYAAQHREQMAEVIAYAKALIVTPRASAEPPPRVERAPSPES